MSATTPDSTEARVEHRLAELTKKRAARKDADDLPRNLTQREVNAYVAEITALDMEINAIRTAAASTSFPTFDLDAKWRDHLVSWRETLNAELLAMPPRIRNEKELDQKIALDWSTRLIDRGFGIATLPIVDLSSTRIGALMAAAGYEVQGEALRGPRGWRGSLPEVKARVKALTAERERAMAKLDALLLTDAERAEQEAASERHRAALATMNVQMNKDGNGLVAYTKDGDPLPVADMTPAQRKAFEWFEVAAYPPREPVTG